MIRATSAALVLVVALGLVPHQASAAPVPVPAVPSLDAGELGANQLGRFLKVVPGLAARIAVVRDRVVAHEQQRQELQTRIQDENSKIDAHNQRKTACARRADAVNTKQDALNSKFRTLSSKIRAHNAEPHEFEIPRQAAAAAAYDAEAAELGAEQTALNAEEAQLESERSWISAEKSAVDDEGTRLESGKRELRSRISAFDDQRRQVATETQRLLQQALGEVQAAADAQRQGVARHQDAGGDLGRPVNRPSTDGGDPVSRKRDGTALDAYAAQRNVQVDKRRATATLTPEAVARIPLDLALRLAPHHVYDGLVEKPGGTYRALQVETTAPRLDQSFDEAIRRGGQATAVVDGEKVTIDEVEVVPAHETPAPRPPSSPALSPEALRLISDLADFAATGNPWGPPPGAITQRPWPDEDATANKPRPRPERCTTNWQDYGDLQGSTWNGVIGTRATGAEACVAKSNPAARPNRLDVEPMGLDTGRGMARCHLIGHKLNGSNTDPRNFVPCYQNPTNNSWMWHGFEKKITAQVDNGNPVYMVVRPIYEQGDPVPVGLLAFALGNDGWTCRTHIPNVTRAQAAADGITFAGC
ncbi:DNA/RNA non-specific endonuclease [Lentzea sp. NPDC051838]|uniref:DNA/RNA non-specific endonuclease n=1 Tax=Lentzea sp. NPDC051838 TaxID=3154849 RepID=UPI0034432BE8